MHTFTDCGPEPEKRCNFLVYQNTVSRASRAPTVIDILTGRAYIWLICKRKLIFWFPLPSCILSLCEIA